MKTKLFQKAYFIVMFLSALLGLLQEQVFAHAFAYYASTPVTPPAEFLWWWPVSMSLLVLGTYFPLRMSLKWSRFFSLAIALLWVTVFSIVFFWVGAFAANVHTGPPPGLGLPCKTYWGRTFFQVGSIFLFWNVFGLFLLMIVPVKLLFAAGEKIEKSKRVGYWSWIITIPIGFVLGMVPYIIQGAWVHGWGGAYVGMRCDRQIDVLHYALVMYALDHENHLPVAKDFTELYPQIESYLSSDWQKYDVCTIGRAWDRTPKPFIWNAAFSGKEVFRSDNWFPSDFNVDCPSVIFEDETICIRGKPWVNCPYRHRDMVTSAGNIRNIEPEKRERLRHYKESGLTIGQ